MVMIRKIIFILINNDIDSFFDFACDIFLYKIIFFLDYKWFLNIPAETPKFVLHQNSLLHKDSESLLCCLLALLLRLIDALFL